MKINADQLTAHLAKNLSPIYFIFGDEYLLQQEACDEVKSAAKTAGFSDRIKFTIDSSFNAELFQNATQNFSLFGDKQLIELQLNTFKWNETTKKILTDYFENPIPEKLLLISANKPEANIQNSNWFKMIERNGTIVQIWPVTVHQLPQWINSRLKKAGLSARPDAVKAIVEYTEGNLLAAAQEIEKLALLYPASELTLEQIINSIADNARYSVFDLMDQILQNHTAKIMRMMHTLKSEGTEPILILWAMTRELRNLIKYSEAINAGQSLATVLIQNKVWEKRKPWISQILKINSLSNLYSLLANALEIDLTIKGVKQGNSWDKLLILAMDIAGTPTIRLLNSSKSF